MPLIRKPDAGALQPKDDVAPAFALRSALPDERWSAVRLLAGQPSQTGLLLDALARENDARVREAILSVLAKDGSAEAIAGIVALIRSPDAAARTAALDAMATVPAAIAANIEILLKDPDRDVRILSCDLVRRLPTAQATGFLIPLLERDGDVNVCAAAVEVLSEVGDEHAKPFLQACSQRFAKDGFLTYAVEEAIRRIGNGDRTPSAALP